VSNLDQGKARQGTTTSVLFPTLPSLSQQPMRVQLYQEEGNHDLLVLQFRATFENWFNLLKTGVPIEFSWSQSPFKNNWIGYVSYVSKQVSGQTEQIMEAGKKYGLRSKIHVNQFTAINGIAACVKHNALSVDHLEIVTDEDIEVLPKESDSLYYFLLDTFGEYLSKVYQNKCKKCSKYKHQRSKKDWRKFI
jgi:hypothetical protein